MCVYVHMYVCVRRCVHVCMHACSRVWRLVLKYCDIVLSFMHHDYTYYNLHIYNSKGIDVLSLFCISAICVTTLLDTDDCNCNDQYIAYSNILCTQIQLKQ